MYKEKKETTHVEVGEENIHHIYIYIYIYQKGGKLQVLGKAN